MDFPLAAATRMDESQQTVQKVLLWHDTHYSLTKVVMHNFLWFQLTDPTWWLSNAWTHVSLLPNEYLNYGEKRGANELTLRGQIFHNSKTCVHQKSLQVSHIYKNLTWRQDTLYYFQGNFLPVVVPPFILSPGLMQQGSGHTWKKNGSLRTGGYYSYAGRRRRTHGGIRPQVPCEHDAWYGQQEWEREEKYCGWSACDMNNEQEPERHWQMDEFMRKIFWGNQIPDSTGTLLCKGGTFFHTLPSFIHPQSHLPSWLVARPLTLRVSVIWSSVLHYKCAKMKTGMLLLLLLWLPAATLCVTFPVVVTIQPCEWLESYE